MLTYKVHEDKLGSGAPPTYVAELEDDNATLCAKLATLERELQTRSPTRAASKEGTTLLDRMSALQVEDKENAGDTRLGSGSPEVANGQAAALKSAKPPTRKVRKLTPRTNIGAWVEDDEDVFWGTP